MTQRGFTLIELLMVIAIIGVLSTIVVVSVTSARNRGLDSAVKENMHTIRNQAELFRTNYNTFGTAVAVQGSPLTAAPAFSASGDDFLVSDRQANSALAEAINAGGSGYYAIGVNSATWAVAVGLKAVTGYWCVDANGEGKVIEDPALGGGSVAALCP